MPESRSGIITLLSDFGLADSFVGAMKGVILSINPRATMVDLTHEIGPQHVRAGALTLLAAYSYYPAGTIHLAVVDPGVGTARRALVCQTRHCFFVGPDNGLLSPSVERDGLLGAYELTEQRYRLENPSHTFHARDIFAPAAAHLSLGIAPDRFGPRVDDPVPLRLPRAEHCGLRVEGEIIHVDRFGNLITNISQQDLAAWPPESLHLWGGGLHLVGLRRTYGDAAPGEPLMVLGSLGFLEIAVNGGNAATELGLSIRDRVVTGAE